ncbi:MAG: glycosyltransferase [Dehalococcoidia bacterium]|jgi:GT2 family glycosyltransferase
MRRDRPDIKAVIKRRREEKRKNLVFIKKKGDSTRNIPSWVEPKQRVIEPVKTEIKPHEKAVVIEKGDDQNRSVLLKNSLKKPLINILIRTSARPNYFKNCIESVFEQTYKNYNIIVGVDDDESLEYVKKYKCSIVRYDFNDVKIEQKSGDLRYGAPAKYNLYLNELHKYVKNGYIMYLDDDDKLNDRDALLKISKEIENGNDLIIYRSQFPKGRIIPSDENFLGKPVLYDISTLCFCFNSVIKPEWEGYALGDFRVITFLYNYFKKITHIDEPLTAVQRKKANGLGRRDDLITETLYDIVIPSWNMSEYVINCLLSIKEHSENYRIVFVDNGSEKSELNKIRKVLKDMPHILIRNKENLGFVKATNMGISASNAKFIVLMNNDTEAVDSWLEKLSEPLIQNENIGLSGPLTTTPNSWQGKYPKGQKGYVVRSGGMFAFFCAMFKKEVFDKVGLLDESFGVGLGDDDDYCHRLLDNGYTMALVQDLIIPHHHRTTFKSIYGEEKIREMQKDAIIYYHTKYNTGKV